MTTIIYLGTEINTAELLLKNLCLPIVLIIESTIGLFLSHTTKSEL